MDGCISGETLRSLPNAQLPNGAELTLQLLSFHHRGALHGHFCWGLLSPCQPFGGGELMRQPALVSSCITRPTENKGLLPCQMAGKQAAPVGTSSLSTLSHCFPVLQALTISSILHFSGLPTFRKRGKSSSFAPGNLPKLSHQS